MGNIGARQGVDNPSLGVNPGVDCARSISGPAQSDFADMNLLNRYLFFYIALGCW
ncbi:hypothetical protein SRDD_08090 [Serratia sp. DD3]|nr:hypothetical protein SRDD_08090 [Serratia sp. DD3]